MIAIRSEREIGFLREANRIVAETLAALVAMVKPGVTTRELDVAAEAMIRVLGAEPAFKGYRGYPASACISLEEVVVHGIPGDRVIRQGEIVSIDLGTHYKGYYGDAAVSVTCGPTDPERQRLLDVTDLALSRAIRAAKAGNYVNDISVAVERTCRAAGFGVVHEFVGHGIGAQMHEPLQIPNFDTGRRGPRLKRGMVLALEPMVNMGGRGVHILEDGWTAVTDDGRPSAHFEHSIVVRDDGGEILSGTDKLVWGRRQE
jgi:methionyl aminopeptidase